LEIVCRERIKGLAIPVPKEDVANLDHKVQNITFPLDKKQIRRSKAVRTVLKEEANISLD
jgi:hypothetical protein